MSTKKTPVKKAAPAKKVVAKKVAPKKEVAKAPAPKFDASKIDKTVVDVISYGESFNQFKPSNNLVIGVKSISRKTDVHLMLIVDTATSFTKEEIEKFINHPPLVGCLVVDPAFKKILPYSVDLISLADNRSDLSSLDMFEKGEKIPYSYNTPFIACCLAYRSGAKRINLYGIDFLSNKDRHFQVPDHGNINDCNIRDFKALYEKLTSLGVEVFVTKGSRLAEFIPTL